MNLEEQFALLVADIAQPRPAPNFLQPVRDTSLRTRTVYSVGEAISQKGRSDNAKLGAGTFRDTGARR